MTAAITGCTCYPISGVLGVKDVLIITPNTANSGDTIDLTSKTVTGGDTFTSGTIYYVQTWDSTTGDYVLSTLSGATLAVDYGGGTTNHVYCVRIVGK